MTLERSRDFKSLVYANFTTRSFVKTPPTLPEGSHRLKGTPHNVHFRTGADGVARSWNLFCVRQSQSPFHSVSPYSCRFETKAPSGTHPTTNLVRIVGLEPTRLSTPEPKSGVSTNFTTSAYFGQGPLGGFLTLDVTPAPSIVKRLTDPDRNSCWCPGRDSNPHPFREGILNPPRLPISSPGRWWPLQDSNL